MFDARPINEWHRPELSWESARKLTGNPDREWSFAIFTERAWVLSGRLPQFFYEPLQSWDTTLYAAWLGHQFNRGQSAPAVSIGFKYFDNFYRAPSGRASLPLADEPYRGRHQVDVVGQRGNGAIVFRNSWGTRWGERGHGTMSREYFDRYVDNVIVRWVSHRGPSPAMFAAIDASKGRRRKIKVDDFRAHWDTQNLTTAASHCVAGAPYTVTSWSVTSLENWTPVWVFELSNAVRVVGRAHLHTFEHPPQAVLKELFIDPGSRRRGLGSLLLAEATSLAASYGFTSISAWIDEADNDPDGQPPLGEVARAFFDAHGWKSGPGRERRPVLVATRHKELS